ncbi:hypothetical protein CUS07_01095 [Enterococcus faecalis]|nr:hypothetical protein CUS33_10980 [Enterococcus faecalis]PQE61658.1 hypothetical protein CUS07_01095 [Enterococcus faecalis]PQF00116.1 hypothetical protein CUS90_04185 [Enterococcus faecalis]
MTFCSTLFLLHNFYSFLNCQSSCKEIFKFFALWHTIRENLYENCASLFFHGTISKNGLIYRREPQHGIK